MMNHADFFFLPTTGIIEIARLPVCDVCAVPKDSRLAMARTGQFWYCGPFTMRHSGGKGPWVAPADAGMYAHAHITFLINPS